MSTFSKEYTTEAIILRKKKGATTASFPYITPKGQLRQGFVENRRLNSFKNGGYLQLFSLVHMTLSEENDFARITQVDGKIMLASLNDLKNISYLSFISELTLKLFEHSDGNRNLYQILKRFIIMVEKKPIPVGSIILAWQLLAIAGFMPEDKMFVKGQEELRAELEKATMMQIPLVMITAIRACIQYKWDDAQIVSMPAKNWERLEQIVFKFAQYQLGEELQSVSFIKQMRYSLLSD